MKTKFNLLLIILVFTALIVVDSTAQDVHFSQFYQSPASLNPASAGNFRGDYRISGIYRRQWQAALKSPKDDENNAYSENQRVDGNPVKPFNTLNVAFDMPLYLGDLKFGAGLMFFNDEVGKIKKKNDEITIVKTMITGTLSSLNKVKGHTIAIGIQPSLTYYNASTSNTFVGADQDFPSDGNGLAEGVWNRLEPSSDQTVSSIKFFDLNVGGMWSYDFGKFEPVVGLGVFHLITPKYSVIEDDARLPNRYVVSFGGTYDLSEKFLLMPNVLFMAHKRVHDLVYGFNIGYRVEDVKVNDKFKLNYIYAGPQLRHSAINIDAVIITVGANLEQWNVGISRDITLSNLKTGTSGQLGAWEFSLVYTKPETLLKKKAIPCERY